MKLHTLCTLIILNTVSLVAARLRVNGYHPSATPSLDHATSFNCYARYVSTPLDKGVLIIHANQDDVSQYIEYINSPKVIFNIMAPDVEGQVFVWPYDMVICVLTNINQFQAIFAILHWWPVWILRTRYLVLYQGEELDDIFALAWKFNIHNIVILHQHSSNVYTYFPYGHGECGGRIRAEVLGICHHISLEELYPTKVPDVFNGCEFIISGRPDVPAVIKPLSITEYSAIDGYEVVVANIILQRLNLTKKMIIYELGRKLPNSSAIYVRFENDLLQNICDMILNSLHMAELVSTVYDVSCVYYIEPEVWFVPVAGPGAQWKSIFLIFDNTLWYAVFGFFLFNSFVWWIIGKVSNWNESYMQCMLGSWLVLMNGAITFPKTTVMRFLIVSWSLCSLVLIAAFQSKFLSILMKPVYDKQIADEQAIVESGIPIYINPLDKVFLLSSGDHFKKQIARKGIVADYYSQTKSRTDNKIYLGTLLTVKYYKGFHIQSNDTNSRQQIYWFKDPVGHNMRCFYFRKGHPIFVRWNKLLLQIIDGGLLDKFMKDADFIGRHIPGEPENVPINLLQLSCAFFILLFGYVLALITFLLEIVFYKIKNIYT